MRFLILLWLACLPAAAQQTYSRLTIIPQADGSAGVLGLRETGGGADIFGLEVGGAMAASYTLRVPVAEPAIGNTLIVDSEPVSGKFQLVWGSGAGGTGCVPAGGAGEVLFSDGAGACSDESTFLYDAANTLLVVSIGTHSTNAANVTLGDELANTKIAIYDGASGLMGLGVSSGRFRLHLNNSGNHFGFFDAPAGNEIMRLEGNGDLYVLSGDLNVDNAGNVFVDGGSLTVQTGNAIARGGAFQTASGAGVVAHSFMYSSTNVSRIANSGGVDVMVWNSQLGQTFLGTAGAPMKLFVRGGIEAGGDIVPDATRTRALGSLSERWTTMFGTGTNLSDNSGNVRLVADGTVSNDANILAVNNTSGALRAYLGNRDGGSSGIVGAFGSGSTGVWLYSRTTAALSGLYVGTIQVVGPRGASVSDCTDGTNTCTQLNALLSRLRAHGLIF